MTESAYKHSVSYPSSCTIRFTRVFEGSIERVWEAFTNPELIRRWMIGPSGWTMSDCCVDARVGGTYRYEWTGDDGQRMGMGGTFLEFDPPRRMKTTQVFDEDWTNGEVIGTLELREEDGRTIMVNTLEYPDEATRDMVLHSPMERGMAVGFERIDAMLHAGV